MALETIITSVVTPVRAQILPTDLWSKIIQYAATEGELQTLLNWRKVCRQWHLICERRFDSFLKDSDKVLPRAEVLTITPRDSLFLQANKVHRYVENLCRFAHALGWKDLALLVSQGPGKLPIFRCSHINGKEVAAAVMSVRQWFREHPEVFTKSFLLLVGQGLDNLPQEIMNFKNTTIVLRLNKMTKIPPYLLRCQDLHRVDLSCNRIKEIPLELYNMKADRVDLSGNPFKAFPAPYPDAIVRPIFEIGPYEDPVIPDALRHNVEQKRPVVARAASPQPGIIERVCAYFFSKR